MDKNIGEREMRCVSDYGEKTKVRPSNYVVHFFEFLSL